MGQMLGGVVFAVFCAGCGFPRPPLLVEDAAVDAGADTPADVAGPDDSAVAATCFGNFLQICLEVAPSTPLVIASDSKVDTDSPLCAAVRSGGENYCVLAATTINVGATLRAFGKRPLVLLATESIVTTGLIDVGSHLGSQPEVGAGADPADCPAAVGPGSGGGVAGGSFFGAGGSGGGGPTGGAGGMPGAEVTSVLTLRGGCPARGATMFSIGGHGGGAVFLIAGQRIDVKGGINAAGQGGLGSSGGSGGGNGGGAGGMIGFDAPTVSCNSLLLASGGGGGEGSEGIVDGADGSDPTTTDAARGGGGKTSNGGDGGNGSSATVGARGMAGAPAFANSGGGGGGGGAGLIKAPATARLGTQLSPPASP